MIVSGISPGRSRAQRLTRGHAAEAAGREWEGGWTETPLGPAAASPALFWYVLYTSQQMENPFFFPFVFIRE